jgi:aldehyde dehydrogenase (NAD+)
VAAARAALDGEWGAMTGFDRARLMRRLAELIERNAEELARAEVSDSGKLYREMVGQTRYLPQWYYYYSSIS